MSFAAPSNHEDNCRLDYILAGCTAGGPGWAVARSGLWLDEPITAANGTRLSLSDHFGVMTTLVAAKKVPGDSEAETPDQSPLCRPAPLPFREPAWASPVYDVWPLPATAGSASPAPEIAEAAGILENAAVMAGPRRLRGWLKGSLVTVACVGVAVLAWLAQLRTLTPAVVAMALAGCVFSERALAAVIASVAGWHRAAVPAVLAIVCVLGAVFHAVASLQPEEWGLSFAVFCCGATLTAAAAMDTLGTWNQVILAPFNSTAARATAEWLRGLGCHKVSDSGPLASRTAV